LYRKNTVTFKTRATASNWKKKSHEEKIESKQSYAVLQPTVLRHFLK